MADNKTLLPAEKATVFIEPIAVRSNTAAQILGVSRPKVYELAACDDFHGAFKLGGCTLFSVEALREWVRNQCREGRTE